MRFASLVVALAGTVNGVVGQMDDMAANDSSKLQVHVSL